MKTSQTGISLIKRFEGCRLETYRCSAGALTIGYGHTGSDVKPGMMITQAQAEAYLAADLKRFERAVDKTRLDLTQRSFDALVSFAYNCGVGNLSKLCKKGRTQWEIAAKILTYNRAGGKVIDGLTRRRKEEAELFKSGIKSDHEVALEVLDDLWGKGTVRRNRLIDAGYSYGNVQKAVNAILLDDGK